MMLGIGNNVWNGLLQSNDVIITGTYVPTLQNIANVNVGSSSVSSHIYSRTNDVVTVSGVIDIVASATADNFSWRQTLPFPTNIIGGGNIQGSLVGRDQLNREIGSISPALVDGTNNQVFWNLTFPSNLTLGNIIEVGLVFQYTIVS